MPILDNKTSNINKDLSISEQELGVDLVIGSNFDLQINNLQDFALIAGSGNAAQALQLKLTTEPLGNKYHPEIGVDLPLGEKTVNALSLQLDIIRSLSVDPRFDDIRATVQIDGNTYFININVTFLNESLSIPLQFVVET